MIKDPIVVTLSTLSAQKKISLSIPQTLLNLLSEGLEEESTKCAHNCLHELSTLTKTANNGAVYTLIVPND